jgi:hypothetical protein
MKLLSSERLTDQIIVLLKLAWNVATQETKWRWSNLRSETLKHKSMID